MASSRSPPSPPDTDLDISEMTLTRTPCPECTDGSRLYSGERGRVVHCAECGLTWRGYLDGPR